MKSATLKKLWRRRRSAKRTTGNRSNRLLFEPLEERRLLALLGITPGLPVISYDQSGTLAYDAGTDVFDLQATPQAFTYIPPIPRSITGSPDLHIQIEVDEDGTLVGGVEGDDLIMTGDIDADGNGSIDYTGILLTGEITEFGSFDATGYTSDLYDFRFTPTGGALKPDFFVGKDIGVITESEESSFVGSFAGDFSGYAKGSLGPIEPLPASLGDYVWEDTNTDGVQNDGDTGIKDVTVNLYDGGDNLVSTTATDVSGYYLFDNLTPGDYYVEFVKPSGYEFSPQDQGTDDTIDSDADPTTRRTVTTTLDSGENDLTWDAGLYEVAVSPTASLGDFVWHDLYHGSGHLVDGIQDAGEPGIEGVSVNLLDGDENVLAATTTDVNGYYLFDDLDAGTYVVEVAPDNFLPGGVLEGWYATLQDEGSDDAADSDGDLATHRSHVVTLADDDHDPTIDFGFFRTCIDLEKTGPDAVDAGETITYHFIVTNCGDVVLHGGAQVYDPLIDPSGNPIWSGTLQPGQVVEFDRTYTTTFGVPQIDFETDLVGNSLTPGQIIDDEFAAFGITVTTHDPVHHPAMIFDSSSPTGGDWDLGTPNVDFGGPGIGSGGGAGMPGENSQPLGKILIISEDGDQNDPDDNACSGRLIFDFLQPVNIETVHVLDIDGNEYCGKIKTFDADGQLIDSTPLERLSNNSFQEVTLDDSNVSRMVVVLPSSGAVTNIVFGEGDCGELVNTATAVGHPIGPDGPLPIVTDEDSWTVQVVCEPPSASLGDFVWHDLYHPCNHLVDGIQDPGEPGIADVVVNLLDTGGNVLATTTTDGSGFYLFEDLDAGTYTVEIASANFGSGGPLEGWYATLPNRGGNDTLDSDGHLTTHRSGPIALAAGEDNRDVDFGFFFTCIDLIKTGPEEVQAGETIVYHFRVENCGDVILHGGAQVYDAMINPCGNHQIWDGFLKPGRVVEFDRSYTTTACTCGELVNTATAVGHPKRPDGVYLPNVTDEDSWTVQVLCLAPASLNGRVYHDLDNNGLDDGEPGIEGVTVTLLDQQGNPLATTTTGPDGSYSFADLAPGTYTVAEGTEPLDVLGLADGDETIGNLGGSIPANDKIMLILASGDEASGYNFGEITGSSIDGIVWEDADEDGEIGCNEEAIEGVIVRLTGTNDRNEAVDLIMTTGEDGVYMFSGLRPSDANGYAIEESQPAGFDDGAEVLGTVLTQNGDPAPQAQFGYVDGNDRFSGIVLNVGEDGEGYNFAEHRSEAGGEFVAAGQTATIGFWRNRRGQALIRSLNGGRCSTELGNWLAETFPNMYGEEAGNHNLAGKTNGEVASFYKGLFKQYKRCRWHSHWGAAKLDPQAMAVALAMYVTNESLAGTVAQDFGFQTSPTGLGGAMFDIDAAVGTGSAEMLFGTGAGSIQSIQAIMALTNSQAYRGVLFDVDASGRINHGERLLRSLANDLFAAINEAGDIHS